MGGGGGGGCEGVCLDCTQEEQEGKHRCTDAGLEENSPEL